MDYSDMEQIGEIENIHKEYIKASNNLYNASLDYIQMRLDNADENRIEFDTMNYSNESVMVSYDGGNHPEYDSNCFSEVFTIYLENGEVYLDIEDCDSYEISNLSGEEMYYLAMAVSNHFDNLTEE